MFETKMAAPAVGLVYEATFRVRLKAPLDMGAGPYGPRMFFEAIDGEVDEAAHAREEVVVVVREPARESSDRLDLLRVAEVLLERALPRHVAHLEESEVRRALEAKRLHRHLELDERLELAPARG